jgi:hypothetical protein
MSPLRHAVSTLISAERSLEWLRSQLVVSTANNLRDRHRRAVKLAMQNPYHSGAKAIMNTAALEAQRSHGWFDGQSLAAYLSYRMFHNTFIYVGTGVSLPVRLNRQKMLIERARRLTQGSNNIDWFLNGVASELSRFVGDTLIVKASLETIQIDDNGRRGEAILFAIRRRPPQQNGS